MYKKILAPLDGSEFSKCSLEHVKAIARGCQVPEVILLMAPEPVQYYGEASGGWMEDLKRQAKDAAEKYIAEVADELKKEGIPTNGVIVSGRADEVILDYARKNKVDLIIMSTHGRSGVARWAFGSVADSVIRNSPIPVLIATPLGCRIR